MGRESLRTGLASEYLATQFLSAFNASEWTKSEKLAAAAIDERRFREMCRGNRGMTVAEFFSLCEVCQINPSKLISDTVNSLYLEPYSYVDAANKAILMRLAIRIIERAHLSWGLIPAIPNNERPDGTNVIKQELERASLYISILKGLGEKIADDLDDDNKQFWRDIFNEIQSFQNYKKSNAFVLSRLSGEDKKLWFMVYRDEYGHWSKIDDLESEYGDD